MIALLRKLHIFAGLQSLVALILFGLAGLCATWVRSPYFTEPPSRTFEVPVTFSQDATDRQLVDQAFAALAIPLAPWPPDWSIKTEGEDVVWFQIWTPKSRTKVTLNRVELTAVAEHRPLSLAERVVVLHEITWQRPLSKADFRSFLWSLYIELSVWSLVFFLFSGVVLWLNAPKKRKVWGLPFFALGWIALLAIVVGLR